MIKSILFRLTIVLLVLGIILPELKSLSMSGLFSHRNKKVKSDGGGFLSIDKVRIEVHEIWQKSISSAKEQAKFMLLKVAENLGDGLNSTLKENIVSSDMGELLDDIEEKSDSEEKMDTLFFSNTRNNYIFFGFMSIVIVSVIVILIISISWLSRRLTIVSQKLAQTEEMLSKATYIEDVGHLKESSDEEEDLVITTGQQGGDRDEIKARLFELKNALEAARVNSQIEINKIVTQSKKLEAIKEERRMSEMDDANGIFEKEEEIQ